MPSGRLFAVCALCGINGHNTAAEFRCGDNIVFFRKYFSKCFEVFRRFGLLLHLKTACTAELFRERALARCKADL